MTDELEVELDDDQIVDDESKQHFNKYLISERIDNHLTSNAPEVAAAVDYLCSGVGYTSNRAHTHMRMLICNLYRNYDNRKDRYTHLCMSKDTGKQKYMPQYNHFRIGYDPLCKCVTYLILNRYIRKKKGYWNKKFEDGYETRLIARGKLIRLLEGRFGVRGHMIYPYPDQQTIIVRKTIREKEVTFTAANGFVRRYKVKIKRPVEYAESTNIKGCRATLKRYNQLLARTFIDIDLAEVKPEECKDDYIDLSKKWVRRIFTDTTSRGGRFFGGWWQQIRKQLRKWIIINGRHTVEIDYAGLHIHILYALRDKKLGDKEPYIVSKDNDHEGKRSLYKRLMLAGVNAKTEKGVITAVVDEVESNPQDYPPITLSRPQFRKQLNKMLTELKEHHSDISKDIHSGKGLKAQYIDSEIAYKVITKMTDKDIPVLCMHDSFICRDVDYLQLRNAMVQAFVDVILNTTNRRKNKISPTVDEVKHKIDTVIEKMPEYKQLNKDGILHTLNPVFRYRSSYYERYILYLASKRTISTFNVSINVDKEVKQRSIKSSIDDKARQESCYNALLKDVLCYREILRGKEYGAGILLDTGLTAYQGGNCPPAQVLSGFTKLQKFSEKPPWASVVGSHGLKPNMLARKWFNLKTDS